MLILILSKTTAAHYCSRCGTKSNTPRISNASTDQRSLIMEKERSSKGSCRTSPTAEHNQPKRLFTKKFSRKMQRARSDLSTRNSTSWSKNSLIKWMNNMLWFMTSMQRIQERWSRTWRGYMKRWKSRRQKPPKKLRALQQQTNSKKKRLKK